MSDLKKGSTNHTKSSAIKKPVVAKIDPSMKTVWSLTLAIASIVAIWFFWPQLGVIALTAVMAFTFYPIYLKLRRKNGGIASIATLGLSFLVVVIPLSFIIFASVGQLMSLANTASDSHYLERLPSSFESVIDNLNAMIEPLTGVRENLTGEGVASFLKNSIIFLARSSAQILMGVLGSVPQMGIALIIYIFLFVEFIRRGPQIIQKLVQLSPLGEEVTVNYLARVAMMTNAMVKGQLIIAMVIAFISSLLLILLGYGQYFFLFFVVFTVLNFIPLGSGIVVLPLSLYSMLTGQFWLALVVITLYYIAGNLDPFMRSKLIPKQIQLSVALTMIATFCGIAYFGILGVIYGPVIMILLTSTVDLYLERKSSIKTSIAS